MAFFTANYETYAILGDPTAPPLWSWRVWKTLTPALDPLMAAARGEPAVRCLQYLDGRAGEVKFGRLGWKESDHQKWTHGSLKSQTSCKSWLFAVTEVWAPSWQVCEREDLAPDVCLQVVNEGSMREQKLSFNPVVVLAVASKLAEREAAKVAAAVAALRELTSAMLAVYCRRPWGICDDDEDPEDENTGFSDAICDLALSGLFKAGDRHTGKVGLHLLDGKWKDLEAVRARGKGTKKT